jgi:hypothetical protein
MDIWVSWSGLISDIVVIASNQDVACMIYDCNSRRIL